jgi:hypothetical protein
MAAPSKSSFGTRLVPKMKMCKHYICGSMCLRTCPYAHGSHDFSEKIPLCRYNLRCRHCDSCQWRHTKSLGRNIDATRRSDENTLCTKFLRGDCNQKDCPFAHGSHQFSSKIPPCRFNERCRDLNACQWRHTVRHGPNLDIIDWKPTDQDHLALSIHTPKKEVHVILALVFKKHGLMISHDIINMLIEYTVKMSSFKNYLVSCSRPDKNLGNYKLVRLSVNETADENRHTNKYLYIKRWPTIFEAMDLDSEYSYWLITYCWWRP